LQPRSCCPLVCLNEATKQLVADITPPQSLQPGQSARQDYEYEQRGTADLFTVSWMDIAECALLMLGRQCLGRRIEDRLLLEREVAAWEGQRNGREVRVDWQFTTSDARIKLTRLYPVLVPAKSTDPDR
jgi:hypothetical protein